ncbi:polysaccharide biosynthesis C-terminal domain-containing protein [Bacillus sp. P14.5]|uniref:polysaccharide biosynthesis C-terminal domain-containing protein n=1 Tax=Bacillus sp. P14.5 TaxID=1983400 RepID=UPI0023DD5D9A|nr:polysaccharide biosynthesis C-terminal domain-containing protein [Bacillus sp. P14.5]
MATPQYYSAIKILPIIITGNIFVYYYSIYINYSYYLKKTKTIAVNTLIAALFNIVANVIFIPKFGYIAAAWTTLAAYILLFILHYLSSKRLFREKGEVIKLISLFSNLGVYMALVIMVFILERNISSLFLIIIKVIIVCLFAFKIFYKEFIKNER